MQRREQQQFLRSIADEVLLKELKRRNLAVHHDVIEQTIHANYTIGACLGKGSSATVYKVTQKQSGVSFAMKVIDKTSEINNSESVEAELKILRAIRHRNVVNLHEVYQSSKTMWLILELVTGGVVEDYLTSVGHYSEVRAAEIIKQALTALHYLHGMGVVHRDIKLSNILRKEDSPHSEIKLGDFGLSAIMQQFENGFHADQSLKLKDCTELTDPWGTPTHMAPEVIAGKYGPQADMWSIGCVLYQLLSGHIPFSPCGKDATDSNLWDNTAKRSALFAKVKRGKFKMEGDAWHEVTIGAKDLVKKLLEKDPKKRLSAGEALQHPWVKGTIGDSSVGTREVEGAGAGIGVSGNIGSLLGSSVSAATAGSGSGSGSSQKRRQSLTPSKEHMSHAQTRMREHAENMREIKKQVMQLTQIFSHTRHLNSTPLLLPFRRAARRYGS